MDKVEHLTLGFATWVTLVIELMVAPCQQIASTCTTINVILFLSFYLVVYFFILLIFFRKMEEGVCGRNQSSTEEEGKISEKENKRGFCSG